MQKAATKSNWKPQFPIKVRGFQSKSIQQNIVCVQHSNGRQCDTNFGNL